MKVTLTTIKNQKMNGDDNMVKINLGECETSLRNHYNISQNKTIYLKIIDVMQDGMNIPKVEYDVYSKLYGDKLIKLNLTVCQNDKMILSIPVELKDNNLDKLNTNSGYYNDICYTTTSENGTDISLKDRKNEYIKLAVCQDGCDFFDYDNTTKRALCSCGVKESSSSFEYKNINKAKLLENIKNIKNIANLNILTCTKRLFSKIGLSKNFGSYIIIIIIIIQIICLFLFYKKDLNLLKDKINMIIYGLLYFNLKKNEELNDKTNDLIQNEIKLDNNINNDINNNNENKKIIKKKKKKKRAKYNIKAESNNMQNNKTIIYNDDYNNNTINNNNNNNDNNKNNMVKDDNINKEIIPNVEIKEIIPIEKIKKMMVYNNDEKNDLPYDIAIEYDNRNLYKYYISLFHIKQPIIFSFCYNKDYNSIIIKISIFFVGFSIFYIVNALFYNDDTMHNILINNNLFDIEYQLPKIIYSSLISMILNLLIEKLALSNDEIIKFKQNKNIKDIQKRGEDLNKKLKIRFEIYFILSFILLLFFWYYISMFGAIYINTQTYLLNDTLISFGLSMVYPFITCLLPAIFRIPALADPKKKKEYLYKFSQILQIF